MEIESRLREAPLSSSHEGAAQSTLANLNTLQAPMAWSMLRRRKLEIVEE